MDENTLEEIYALEDIIYQALNLIVVWLRKRKDARHCTKGQYTK